MIAIQGFLGAIGAAVLGLCSATGALVLFTLQSVMHVFRPPWYPAEIARQLLRIGYFSLPVVGLTAFFTGAALALQIYTGGARFNVRNPWCPRLSPSAWCVSLARCWAG